ncbi:hypothetical protein D3C75_824180 [compost metagenome]
MVQRIGTCFGLCIIRTHTTQVHLPRCDADRPDGAVLIPVNLAYGCGQPADANAVAAHQREAKLTCLIRCQHTHGAGIFVPQLKDIPHFNTPREGDRMLPAYRTNAALPDFRQVMVLRPGTIPFHIQTGVVVVRHISSAAESRSSLQ